MRATLPSVVTPIAAGLAAAAMVLAPMQPSGALAQETRTIESAAELSPAERDLLHELVREAILERPEVILEALDRLRSRTPAAAPSPADTAPVHPTRHHAALFEDPQDLRLGNPEGPIRIVKFVDYACGFCRRAGIALEEILATQPDVQVIVKELPVLGPASIAASRAVLAAARQDPTKAAALHRRLLRAAPLDAASIEQAMAEVGIEAGRRDDETEAAAIGRNLAATAELARQLGISGTPWFVTPAEVLRGFPGEDALVALVARERQRLAGHEGAK